MVFGVAIRQIVNGSCDKRALVIIEATVIALVAIVRMLMCSKRVIKFITKYNWALLIIDLVVFWTLSLMPKLDPFVYALVSNIDYALIFMPWLETVIARFNEVIPPEDRTIHDRICDSLRAMIQLGAMAIAYFSPDLELQRIILMSTFFSTFGSAWVWWRYKKMLEMDEMI